MESAISLPLFKIKLIALDLLTLLLFPELERRHRVDPEEEESTQWRKPGF